MLIYSILVNRVLFYPDQDPLHIQPLDVYFFRMWKNFVRKFSDTIILFDYDIHLHLRDNILKLQSLVHNQFTSPRFQNFIRYSWFKSGVMPRQRPSTRVIHTAIHYTYYITLRNVRDVSKLRQPLAVESSKSAICERIAATGHGNAYHAQEGYKNQFDTAEGDSRPDS